MSQPARVHRLRAVLADDDREMSGATLGRAFKHPSVRAYVTWTPSMMRSAMTMADGGSLRMAADLCELILADERVQADMGKRVRSLAGRIPQFVSPATGKRLAAKIEKALSAERDGGGGDWWEMFPESELCSVMAWGLMLGAGLGQFVWKERMGRDVPCLEMWHPRLLRWDQAEQVWKVTVCKGDPKTGGTEEVAVREGEARWFLFLPYGKHRPWASGLWRGISRWWLLKDYAIRDWAQHSENASTLVAESPEGATKKHREELASDLYDMGKDARIALPPGFKLELLEATANTRDIYDAQVDTANRSITIGIMGVNLATEVKGGSYAAAEIQSEIADDLKQADAETASTQTREQVLLRYSELNFGDAEAAPWPYWETKRAPDRQRRAEAYKTLGEALEKLLSVSIRVDADTILEDAGVPLLSEKEAEKKEKEEGEKMPKPPPAPGQPVQAEQAEQTPQPPAAQRPQPQATVQAVEGNERPGTVGQRAIDQLGEDTIDQLAIELAPFAEGLMELIDKAETVEELEAAALEYLEKSDSGPAVDVLERALIVAELAGRGAAMREAPSLADAPDPGMLMDAEDDEGHEHDEG